MKSLICNPPGCDQLQIETCVEILIEWIDVLETNMRAFVIKVITFITFFYIILTYRSNVYQTPTPKQDLWNFYKKIRLYNTYGIP